MPRLSTRARIANALAISAFAAWAVSLGLPGFTAGGEAWTGGPILGYGLAFGWLCGGWAAYANIFFLAALLRFSVGAFPIVALALMVALAGTLPMFDALPRGESGATTPIESWGLGVAIWLLSLVLLVGAVVVRDVQSKRRPKHAL